MITLLNSRVAKNASWLIGVKVIQSIMGFFVGMFTARYLGPANYGLVNYASSVVAFMIPIMNLGINNILVQELLEDSNKEGETLGTAIALCSINALICSLGVVLFSLIVNRGEKETTIICALYSSLLLSQALEMIIYWYQAHLLSKYSSLVSFFAYLLVSSYKIFLLVTQKSVRWFAISNSIDCFFIAVALYVIYRRMNGIPLSFSLTKARKMLSKSKYYIVANLMVVIFAETDKVMLKQMIGPEYTGYYSAAVGCATMTSFVFAAIIDSFRPLIFEKKRTNLTEYKRNLVLLYSVVLYISLLQSLVMTFGAKLIITIIYGNEYNPAVNALRICVWYTTFSYFGAIRNIWMLVENKQKYLLLINFTGALCNVLLNLVFIPMWGINGAAIASLITQFFTNVIVGFLIPPIRENNKIMMKGINPKYCISILRIENRD